MPTAAKLFGAAAFAILAFVAAEVFKTTLPERTVWGAFSPLSAVVGALCGWLVMGGLTGYGYGSAMGSGVRTSVTIAFWLLLGFSTYEMVMLSMKMRYDGPMEAVVGVFDLMLQHGREMGTPQVLGTLFVGGVLGGAVAEWGGTRWR